MSDVEDDSRLTENAPLAFGLCIGAGLATCVGAAVVYNTWLVRIATKKVLAGGLGLSSGVMLYVSFGEIFNKSFDEFKKITEREEHAYGYATASFFCGILIMKLIDFIVHRALHTDCDPKPCCTDEKNCRGAPIKHDTSKDGGDVVSTDASDIQISEIPETTEVQSPLHVHTIQLDKDMEEEFRRKKLRKMGIVTALAIGIHNFPEGLATFMATLMSPGVGVPLAVGIAIHNIPEGICVALPIYYATGNRHKAFFWAFISGISEPIGALIGWGILSNALEGLTFGILFGVVAGMMVTIVCHELLPTAHRYDPTDKVVTNSLILGMMIMAASLLCFQL